MKSIKIVIVAILFFITTGITAQAKVNIQYGTPPVWAPAAPVKTQYYYLPDIETYYDVPAQRYIYLRNGSWVRTAALPVRYRGYDLYKGHTVYLTDYRGNSPYTYYKQHKVKYVANRKWKTNGHDNGNHYGNYKGNHGSNHYGNDKEKGNGKGNGKGHGKK